MDGERKKEDDNQQMFIVQEFGLVYFNYYTKIVKMIIRVKIIFSQNCLNSIKKINQFFLNDTFESVKIERSKGRQTSPYSTYVLYNSHSKNNNYDQSELLCQKYKR